MFMLIVTHSHGAQVQPPPGANGQNQQPQYAPVLAPVMPMMMPYGMMPYPAAPMPAGHAQAFPHMQPHAPAPAAQQQAPRRNNGFAGGCSSIREQLCAYVHRAGVRALRSYQHNCSKDWDVFKRRMCAQASKLSTHG